MVSALFEYLELFDNFMWMYFGFPAIILMGLYLSLSSGFVQLRRLPDACKTFFRFLFRRKHESDTSQDECGISPMAVFFAGLGGCVGIGNVVAITTAVQIGGPGACFWMWLTAIIGSVIKYSEVFLGIRFRIKKNKRYCGGPMHFLTRAFNPTIAGIFCVLMCIYGVEIFQFSVVTNSISHNFGFDKTLVTFALLGLVVLAELGGIKRVGAICTTVIPLFIVIYLAMGSYVLIASASELPRVFLEIIHSAFNPMAAIGSFAGSSILLAISQGMRRGCYSSDIGVGYASIIHSSTRVKNPAEQAALVIFEVFFDTFIICTMSIMLVLVTGTWKEDILPMHLVQNALAHYFPYMHYFMPFFLFLLGYTTVITYFSVGIRTAEHVGPKYGRFVYYCYSFVVLFIFSFVETKEALIVMSIVQVLLLALNLAGIFRLRKEIGFDISTQETVKPVEQPA